MHPIKSWRPVHVLKLIMRKHWCLGCDPRRSGGITIVSPRGTVYEFRPNPPRARPYRDFTLQ